MGSNKTVMVFSLITFAFHPNCTQNGTHHRRAQYNRSCTMSTICFHNCNHTILMSKCRAQHPFTVKLIFYIELTESAEESRLIKMASWSNLNQKSQKKFKRDYSLLYKVSSHSLFKLSGFKIIKMPAYKKQNGTNWKMNCCLLFRETISQSQLLPFPGFVALLTATCCFILCSRNHNSHCRQRSL